MEEFELRLRSQAWFVRNLRQKIKVFGKFAYSSQKSCLAVEVRRRRRRSLTCVMLWKRRFFSFFFFLFSLSKNWHKSDSLFWWCLSVSECGGRSPSNWSPAATCVTLFEHFFFLYSWIIDSLFWIVARAFQSRNLLTFSFRRSGFPLLPLHKYSKTSLILTYSLWTISRTSAHIISSLFYIQNLSNVETEKQGTLFTSTSVTGLHYFCVTSQQGKWTFVLQIILRFQSLVSFTRWMSG